MKRTRLLLLLALLMTAATGAWAQSATTHVVTQATVNDIFSGDGYTLGDDVKAGDVLDFQGIIDIDHSLVINKPVNIISSSNPNAVVKLNSASNTEYPVNGDPGRAFVINKAGSGTTVQGIRIENTQTWLYNTSNITFTGVTMWVEEATVSSGVGQVSIRYSDHITFDGCTVYAKNNGGSSGCMLVGSHDCTFKDTRFEAVGIAGNVLYLGSTANIDDKPADYTMNADNISVLNCTLTKDVAIPICMFAIGGLRHHIEGCTIVNMNASSGWVATVPNSANEGHTILNNTITDGTLDVLNYCTAEGNTVTGTVNVQKGATLTGNTINGNVEVSSNSSDFVGSTITGNTINGTVTFAANSKNNTLTRNVITSTGDYAVVMASTADANNTVQYNTLIAATKKGDEAVNLSNGSGNTISNNSNIALMLADGTKDAANWSATVNGEQPNPLPVGGLSKGDAVTLTYSGHLKVKSVTADAANPNAYLMWDATKKKLVEAEIPATATPVENADSKVTWEAGTYLVEGNVTINGEVKLSGDVELIIKDGAKLTAKQVYASNNISLNIYGQSNGSGELNVVCSGGNAISTMSELNIHGCKVIASSSSTGNGGIGSIGTLNVYDGSVDAKNTYIGYGIYINQNGSLNIYGGQVKAEGKGTTTKSYGITGSSGVTVTVYDGKLWAGCADKAAFKSGITLKKGEGFTGTIQTSSDDSTYNTYSGTNTPTTEYVRVGY